jgi:hypothetical protein
MASLIGPSFGRADCRADGLAETGEGLASSGDRDRFQGESKIPERVIPSAMREKHRTTGSKCPLFSLDNINAINY